jgi:hypothetical protein
MPESQIAIPLVFLLALSAAASTEARSSEAAALLEPGSLQNLIDPDGRPPDATSGDRAAASTGRVTFGNTVGSSEGLQNLLDQVNKPLVRDAISGEGSNVTPRLAQSGCFQGYWRRC